MLFVGRTVAHFSYYESVIASLLERGAEVELVLDRQWSKNWAGGDQSLKEFQRTYPSLKTDWIVRRSDERRERIFALRELRSYRSYLVRRSTTPYYIERWRSYLSPEWKRRSEQAHFRWLLKSPLGGLLLQAAERNTPNDPAILDFVRRKAPDVMVVSPMNMRFSEETDYVKAARELGIPVGLPVLSWDNLSTKGLIQIQPDRLFVWNEHQKSDALEVHGLPARRVVVSGAPFFDKWFDPPTDGPSRAEFARMLGFDPEARILLYLGSSKNIAADESWFVEAVRDALRASPDPVIRSHQILVRPHPANAAIYKRLSGPGLKVWPADGALPETKQSFAEMRWSFQHADAAVGINTSGMIDAVLADLPTFSVGIEQYAATQQDSVHFRYLVKGEVLYLTSGVDQLVEGLGRLAAGEDPKARNRRVFARDFARPQGLERKAGDVVAEGVLALAGGGASNGLRPGSGARSADPSCGP